MFTHQAAPRSLPHLRPSVSASSSPPISSARDSTSSAYHRSCRHTSAFLRRLQGKPASCRCPVLANHITSFMCITLNLPLPTKTIPALNDIARRKTHPFCNPITNSRPLLPSSLKFVTRNQLVCRLSFGPYDVPITYRTNEPLDVSTTSGSVPRRPTRVMRASWEGRVVENARAVCLMVVVVPMVRRMGDRRKDMVANGVWCRRLKLKVYEAVTACLQ